MYILFIIAVLFFIMLVDIIFLLEGGLKSISYSPKGIKEYLEVTWFGAIVIFIFQLVIFWLHYLIILILLIFKGWKWVKEFLGE